MTANGSWNELESRSRGLLGDHGCAGWGGRNTAPWGELVAAHAFRPSDYDLECRSLPEIYGGVVGLKNVAKIGLYNSP
jgi:hypothetical protein